MFLIVLLIGLALGFIAALWASRSWPFSGSKRWEGMWESSDAGLSDPSAPLRPTTSKASDATRPRSTSATLKMP
ncbi:MAG TPA: hypothetical protein VM899_00730 [Rubellimicrobium sp.]|nr:hypothetical protein [Rubellimicrobium sp.]